MSDNNHQTTNNNPRKLRVSSAPVNRSFLEPQPPSKRLCAPYAPRGALGYHGGGAFVPSHTGGIPSYNPFDDPYLVNYYERKFGAYIGSPRPKTSFINDYGPVTSDQWGIRKRRPILTTGRTSREVTYKVAVTTSDEKGAGTSAPAYITLRGVWGQLTRQRLCKRSIKTNKKLSFEFSPGSTHVFPLKSQDLGEIQSIVIEHMGLDERDSWLVQSIEILNSITRKSWLFVCNHWLSLYKEDGQVSRELFGVKSSKTKYEIMTVTGDVDSSSCTSKIFVTIFGRTGITPRIELKNGIESENENSDDEQQQQQRSPSQRSPSLSSLNRRRSDSLGRSNGGGKNKKSNNLFQQGKSAKFIVRAPCVGPIIKVRIQHDNTGNNPHWFLDRMVVTDLKHPKWKFYFNCGQWLSRTRGDGVISKDFHGSRDPLGIPKNTQYKLTLYTGNRAGAGTNAHIHVQLFGKNGESKEENIRGNFSRGSVDEAIIFSRQLGTLERLKIGHDNTGVAPGWFLEKVIVDDLVLHKVYEFLSGQWFSKDEDDGAIERELISNALSSTTDGGKGSGGKKGSGSVYEIRVTTGDKSNAATSARVYIIMYGPVATTSGKNRDKNNTKELCSGRIWLESGLFERSRTDIFKIDIPQNLSPLSKIDIGHDNSGAGPGWFLDKVVVNSTASGIEQTFPCMQWLAKDESDRKIERTLLEDSSLRKTRARKTPYIITVHTSDTRNAGTSAQVSMVLYGDKGKTDDVILVSEKNDSFERGAVDKFRLELPDVGVPYKMRIGHDNSGASSGWLLDKCTLTDVNNQKEYVFKCGRWLAEDEDDHAICRELPATGPGIKRPAKVKRYRVQVFTGKRKFAGTDANVFINVYGQKGDTGDRFLTHSSTNKNKFERGNMDDFILEAVELGPIQKVRIGHDAKNAGSGWFLDKVIVWDEEDEKTKATYECHRWFDSQEDDGLIVRELKGSTMLDRITYEVSVKTADKSNAGTDANVFLKIFGVRGDSGNLQLKTSDSALNKFERGHTDTFKVEAEDLGELKSIRISHDGSGPGSGWYLEEVRIIVPHHGRRYVFVANRWLDKNENDGKLEVDLDVTKVENVDKTIPYEITVYTGDVINAGTDAHVFIQIYGEDGTKTDEQRLRNRSDTFERGTVDKFKINALDVGPIQKIRVGHDGKGVGAGWFLDKICIQRHVPKGSKRRASSRTAGPSSTRKKSSVRDKSPQTSSSRRPTTAMNNNKSRGNNHNKKNGRSSPSYSSASSKASSLTMSESDSLSHVTTDDDYDDHRYSRLNSNKSRLSGRESSLGSRRPTIQRHSSSISGSSNLKKKPPSGRETQSFRRRQKSSSESLSEEESQDLSDYDDRRSMSLGRRSGGGAGGNKNRSSLSLTSSSKDPRGGKKAAQQQQYSDKNKAKTRGKKAIDSDEESEDLSDYEDHRSSSLGGRRGTTTSSGNVKNRSLNSKDARKKVPEKGGGRNVHSRNGKRKSDESEEEEDEEEEKGLSVVTGEEEVEEYWFVCNQWLARDEGDGMIVRELLPENSKLKELEYLVSVKTGKKFGSGTDANVFITLYGAKSDSGERELRDSLTNKNKFERNNEDQFKVKAIDLGDLRKVKIRHDNAGGGAAWFLDSITVKHPGKNREFFFPCQKWLSADKGDGLISRDLPAVDPNLRGKDIKDSQLENSLLQTTYHVKVTTGDKWGAGTDANVHIILYGDQNDTGIIPLKKSINNRNKFERKNVDEFIVKASDIGNIKKIRIGHDDQGGGADWYLERVEIISETLGKSWFFDCNDWIGRKEGDGKLERELYPLEDATLEFETCIPYEITTYTSDIRGGGTSANVFIQIYGRTICTKQKFLCSKIERDGKFKRGAKDTFIVELEDVEDPIEKIRIGHDDHGITSGWHLNKVEIRRMKEKKKGSLTYVFPCNRWLARDEEDSAIERELVASKIVDQTIQRDGKAQQREQDTKGTLKMKKYKISIFTGDVKNAGTDANVFLTLFGNRGDSGERKLVKSETYMDKFERGHCDVFAWEAVDLGELFKLKIRHDNAGPFGSSWFLEKVEVTDIAENKTYPFFCERWLSKDKEDKKLERTIYVQGYEGDMSASSTSLLTGRSGSMMSLSSSATKEPFSRSPHLSRHSVSMDDIPQGPIIPYTVIVTTGTERDMASKGPIWIDVYGVKNKHTGRLPLQMLGKDKFERGSTNTFSVDAVDVGDVKKIELGNDGVDSDSGWFVKDVRVEQPTKGKVFYFHCMNWLARDKADKKTIRMFELSVGDPESVKTFKPKISYEITIFTGDMDGAGTDNIVFLQLFGTKGGATELELLNVGERFQRGRKDFIKAELEDVGKVVKLRARIDGKGERPNWFLEKVELRNMSTMDLFTFKAQQWLGKKKGHDGALYIDIPASVNGRVQASKTNYQITVKTSDVTSAGTGANVFVRLFGELGDSGDLHLKKSEKNKDPFERNQTDVFVFNDIISLGQLARCRVWHDNKGFGSSWHLAFIEVQDLKTKRKWKFPCDKWLSTSEDDKQISRDLVLDRDSIDRTVDDERSLPRGAKGVYDIEVVTGDSQDSGTSQDGWIVLEGERGTSQPFRLRNSIYERKLARGQTDQFQLKTNWLGKLSGITIGAVENQESPLGKEHRGRKAKWFCQEVTVRDNVSGKSYVFKVRSWLNVTSEISRRDAEEIPVARVNEDEGKLHIKKMKELQVVNYEVVVFTGDKMGSGTNANVSITIYGKNGDSGIRPLKQKGRDLFERKQVDKFQLECTDLGELERVKIEHDNSGFRPDWFLDHVEVKNLSNNKLWLFPCQQWLSEDKGDNQVWKMLFASTK